MVGRCLSVETKRRRQLALLEKWSQAALDEYRHQQTRPLGPGEKRKGLRVICHEINERCLVEDKKVINITKSALQRRLKGGKSRADTLFERNSWLTQLEEQVVVDFALACADQGFPWDIRRLEEYTEEICKSKYDDFPGLGKNWGDRFVARHRDALKPCWSHSLDHQRARGANPVTKEAYFDILQAAIDGEEGEDAIREEDIYGVDETGIQAGVGQKRRVLGRTGAHIQHQQRSGDRENITVIITICADGTSLAPTVIFKGKAHRTSWKQNNPLKASLGRSEKGWTDGEIGVEWIKDFDRRTKAKADGRRRLLLVDGHNSHYTSGFLRYAKDNNIVVICYPSHSTHIYQGLDVIIFGPLKTAWTKARDHYERKTGLKINKTCFLEVYGMAHVEALSPGNIKAAFRKTGVVPFNPDVVTETMLAPSLATSLTSSMPIPLPSPTQALSDTIHALLARQVRNEAAGSDAGDSDGASDDNVLPCPQLLSPSRHAISNLQSTSASFLVLNNPLTPKKTIPRYQPYTISPFHHRHQDLFDLVPANENEHRLQDALRESEARDQHRKHNMIAMQATAVMQDLYVKETRVQLHAAENRKNKEKGMAMDDGMPKLLTDEQFMAAVDEREKRKHDQEQEKKDMAKKRDAHREAVALWEEAEKARVARNDAVREEHQRAVIEWELEVKEARAEKRKPGWTKPKRGPLEKAVPKPVLYRRKARSAGDEDDDDAEEMDVDGDKD